MSIGDNFQFCTLNGPLSTHPAPLTLPIRSEHPSTFKYLLTLGKAYATFYKSGVIKIYTNYKASVPLQSRLDRSHHSSLPLAISSHSLNRQEFQLLQRNWHDITRVPLFGLVFLICGEFTPLVVVALSGIVPWTCRIPRQINSDRGKLEKRRTMSFRNLTQAPPPSSPSEMTDVETVRALSRMQLLHISWSLGLSSSIWDYLGGNLPGLPTFVLRRRVEKRVEYLEMDDVLLGKDGKRVGELEEEELVLALVDRGVDVLGRGEDVMRGDLESWLRSRSQVPMASLMLTRPNTWPSKPKYLTKEKERNPKR
ncbi:hypothetical protein BJ875DRAFT_507396 [Amylocarpus encephaloides]|uniref:Letm1 RBD domain-containing protein n=1 Tax=Amylocarpus encephaloides TaxID=45428 RepID=A0A9P7YAH5_9HELO|nr:hypothetical protein BJ875DRAFT_507396 [Amylocarpus encephaloides]